MSAADTMLPLRQNDPAASAGVISLPHLHGGSATIAVSPQLGVFGTIAPFKQIAP
jgi:hypothetical protein